MSLENLLKIGQLKPHSPDAAEIQKLLNAAERNLADARVTTISLETRFDAAYKAIVQSALAALMSCGYKPNTNRPGHHMTVIQSLSLTVGLPGNRIAVLDTLRRKRNVLDYTGEDMDEASARTCISEAAGLLGEVRAWLKSDQPDQFGGDS